MRAAVATFATGLLCACSFDPSGSLPGGGDGGPGGDGGRPDSGPCLEAIHAQLAANGVAEAAEGEPLVTVLIGDSVELSALGSCTQSGTIDYQWSIVDQDDDDKIEGTAAPDLTAEAIDVYPLTPGDYTVELTVGDGAERADAISVLAIRAVGWKVSGEALDVRDLAVTGGNLWVATSAGASQLAITNVLGVSVLVNDLANGDDDIPNDLSAVAAGLDSTVWFGHKPNDSLVWRVDLDPNPRTTAIDFTPNFEEAEVRKIGRGATGIVIATRDGVSAAPDNQTFEAPLITASSFALTRGDSGAWAGGTVLYRLPDGTEFDVFEPGGNGDNKIRALLDVEGQIWAGSDGFGVALYDPAASDVLDIFTAAADDLPSDKARSIAVDTTGDIWVATDKGVARYKQDRALWVPMGAASGLDTAIDIQAIETAGSNAQRKIIAGTRQGVALLTLPD